MLNYYRCARSVEAASLLCVDVIFGMDTHGYRRSDLRRGIDDNDANLF